MKPATEAQTEYLSTLFVDCGFTRAQRKAWLRKRFPGHEHVFLDELTTAEAHQAIDELKDLKERNWTAPVSAEVEE